MIVDDEIEILTLIKNTYDHIKKNLSNEYNIHYFDKSIEAYEFFKVNKDKIDLIVCQV